MTMTSERPARRYAAHSFPEIQGIRLVPPGAAATLVNLSATGVLVECESRLLPGKVVTVEIAGTFSPASIEGRVIRCEVIGIATNGSLGYRIGLAFSTRIALPKPAEEETDVRAAAPVALPPAAAPGAIAGAPVLRNRW
jgi:hypothetical protein